jgi:ferredoxin
MAGVLSQRYLSRLHRSQQGHVRYEIPWPGLSPEEKEAGYCLPCVARPIADVVIARV